RRPQSGSSSNPSRPARNLMIDRQAVIGVLLPLCGIRISPAGSDARKAAQVRILAAQPTRNPLSQTSFERVKIMATIAPTTETAGKQQRMPKSEQKMQRGRHDEKFKIFCGTANEPLTEEICAFLQMDRGKATVTRFSDGEVYVQIMENV